MRKMQSGQSTVTVAIFLPLIVFFGLYMVVNAMFWANTVATTRQAVNRAAQSGASALGRLDSMPMTVIADPEHPALPAAAARHCLNPERARQVTLEALEQNLAMIPAGFVADDGSPLTPAQVVADTTGTYLIEIKAVNPPGLGCPASDPEPAYPPGAVYPYQQPYVHLAVYLPIKAVFGNLIPITPEYVFDVSSAVDPAGGNDGS